MVKTKRSWNAVEFSPEREWVEWGMAQERKRYPDEGRSRQRTLLERW